MFLSVGGKEYVTIKSRSIAKEMTTGTIGTTAVKKIELHKTMYRQQYLGVHGHWKRCDILETYTNRPMRQQ